MVKSTLGRATIYQLTKKEHLYYENKKFLTIISILCFSSNYIYANSNQTANIEIRFTAENPSKFSNPHIKAHPNPCGGENGYYVNYLNPVSNDKFLLGLAGPFEGDERKLCKIDNGLFNDDEVYFILTNLDVGFSFEGVGHSCIIDQEIGTSYDNLNDRYDKLQGMYKDTIRDCAGNKFQYILHPGNINKNTTLYHPGYIEIFPAGYHEEVNNFPGDPA